MDQSEEIARLRARVAELSLAQVRKIDPNWHPAQRDCAGLVRFVYRGAYKSLRPARLKTPLWRDGRGEPSDFADAETLIAHNFVPLGRSAQVLSRLRSGDVLAFRREENGAAVFHLMLLAREGRSGPLHVVYHPGEAGAAVRFGRLDALDREAPIEWRPSPENGSFLGFYRFKEWRDDES